MEQNWQKIRDHIYAGNLEVAERTLLSILESDPDSEIALELLSNVYYRKKDLDKSIGLLLHIKSLGISSSQIENKISQIYLDEKRYSENIQHIEKCLSYLDQDKALVTKLGKSYLGIGDTEQSIDIFKNLLSKYPDDASIIVHLSEALYTQGALNEALDLLRSIAFDRVLYPKAYRLFTTILKEDGQMDALLAFLTFTEKNNPDHAINLLNLGVFHKSENNSGKALQYFKKCMEKSEALGPLAFLHIAALHLENGNFEEYSTDQKELQIQLKNYVENDSYNYELPLFQLMYYRIPRELHVAAVRKNSYLLELGHQEIKGTTSIQKGHNREKIRIGYISPHFRRQASGLLYYDIFRHHNKSEFEIFGYSLSPKTDELTSQIRSSFDHYRDLSKISTRKCVDLIKSDNLDIIISTAGYYDNMRMEILACRVAPIQINSEGYNDTLQASFIDYFIADQTIIEESLRPTFSEKIIYFPDSAMINSPLLSSPDRNLSRDTLQIPSDSFVYGSMHKPEKITSSLLDCWVTILKGNEKSVLLFYDNSNPVFRKSISDYFQKHEVSPSRIIFTGKIELEKHQARLQCIDLVLDSFIYNAQTTAVECLRLGVPIITLLGDTPNRRYGASILKSVELQELIARTEQEYISKSLKIGEDRSYHENIKRKISNGLNSNNFYKTERYTFLIEKACKQAMMNPSADSDIYLKI